MAMFSGLIRRKARHHHAKDEAAFQSTTFSLTCEVPRPAERRAETRVAPMLRVGKLATEQFEQLIRVRNVSAGGLAAELGHPVEVGSAVTVELSGQRIPGQVVWTREGTAGIKFEQNIDLGELLAGRKQRMEYRQRPPRLDVRCAATLRVGSHYYTVEVQDISLGGVKVEPIEEYCLGQDVTIVIESFRPVKGQVRWFSDRRAGIVFDTPLSFEELAEWIGKRLEVATLKASLRRR